MRRKKRKEQEEQRAKHALSEGPLSFYILSLSPTSLGVSKGARHFSYSAHLIIQKYIEKWAHWENRCAHEENGCALLETPFLICRNLWHKTPSTVETGKF